MLNSRVSSMRPTHMHTCQFIPFFPRESFTSLPLESTEPPSKVIIALRKSIAFAAGLIIVVCGSARSRCRRMGRRVLSPGVACRRFGRVDGHFRRHCGSLRSGLGVRVPSSIKIRLLRVDAQPLLVTCRRRRRVLLPFGLMRRRSELALPGEEGEGCLLVKREIVLVGNLLERLTLPFCRWRLNG